ncbi:Holliday junction resolvase RuvX [Ruminococcus sp. FC2018]|uniref:Holliday junction resolvase RuvX n=1 Tax=Ruminococcus sp. FC2018 TaxID=1410617 RepID=UPI00048D54CB|nr:Holliday junction resolvase RuvX [Ruminococcus sp. FC2018]
MKILAVDYGDVRTGIAISDNSEFLASPVGTVTERDPARLAQKVADTAKERGAQHIIVGLPINMNGTRGPRAEKCEEFAALLRELVDCPVQMWDERSTTVTAHNILNTTNVRGKARKAVVDTVAASIILESYLEYRRKNSRAAQTD